MPPGREYTSVLAGPAHLRLASSLLHFPLILHRDTAAATQAFEAVIAHTSRNFVQMTDPCPLEHREQPPQPT